MALALLAGDGLVVDATVGVLRRVGLVDREGPVVSMHRLVQTVLRERLSATERDGWAVRVLELLERALPDPEDHLRWPEFELLLPHVDAAIEHAVVPLAVSARLLNQTGIYLIETARYKTARANLQRALSIEEAVYGPDHPEVAITLTNLGVVQQALGDNETARATLQRALTIFEAVYGPDHPEVAITLGNLGNVQRALGENETARATLQRALTIFEAAYGPDHPSALQARKILAGLRYTGHRAGTA